LLARGENEFSTAGKLIMIIHLDLAASGGPAAALPDKIARTGVTE